MFDSAEEKAFLVHLPHKIIRFYQMKNGLYKMNPKSDLQPDEKVVQLVNTVHENMQYMTPLQI
eukprot:5241701-Ditylum_brightwellii.AAC.1